MRAYLGANTATDAEGLVYGGYILLPLEHYGRASELVNA
jgi:hypothetical protein